MSVIHKTTLTPTKLELLSGWLPAQPWYAGEGAELVKAGGFRLDDPAGAVGIELMAVGDGSVVHHVPLTYRAAPLPTEDGLIGTMEHGVLGRRYAYDAVHDPVFVEQVLALMRGRVQAQAQSISDTVDDSVTSTFVGPEREFVVRGGAVGGGGVRDGRDGSEVPVGDGVVLRVVRVLRAGSGAGVGSIGHVMATWRSADGAVRRGCFASLGEVSSG